MIMGIIMMMILPFFSYVSSILSLWLWYEIPFYVSHKGMPRRICINCNICDFSYTDNMYPPHFKGMHPAASKQPAAADDSRRHVRVSLSVFPFSFLVSDDPRRHESKLCQSFLPCIWWYTETYESKLYRSFLPCICHLDVFHSALSVVVWNMRTIPESIYFWVEFLNILTCELTWNQFVNAVMKEQSK